jgi:hypothetical protein
VADSEWVWERNFRDSYLLGGGHVTHFFGLVSGKTQRRVRTASEERNFFRSRESAIDSAKRCVTARPRASSALALSES